LVICGEVGWAAPNDWSAGTAGPTNIAMQPAVNPAARYSAQAPHARLLHADRYRIVVDGDVFSDHLDQIPLQLRQVGRPITHAKLSVQGI